MFRKLNPVKLILVREKRFQQSLSFKLAVITTIAFLLFWINVKFVDGLPTTLASTVYLVNDPIEAANGRAPTQSENPVNMDTEIDGLLDGIINTNRGGRRLILRNSSELHIDNHTNENFNQEIGKEQMTKEDSTILVLQRPFHFHVPILKTLDLITDNDNGSGKVENTRSKKTPLVQEKSQTQGTERSGNPKWHQRDSHNSHSSISGEGDKIIDDGEASARSILFKRETKISEGNNTNLSRTNASASSEHLSQIAGHFLRHYHPNPGLVDLDHLLDQHPSLIPPIDRKRNSGRRNLEDDDSHHILIMPFPTAGEDSLVQGDQRIIRAKKRDVKSIKFSQDAVESILQHEDDFVKYRMRIESHAEKLGIPPQEVFHALVYGKPLSNKTTNKTIHSKWMSQNMSNENVHERRKEFHHLFLEDTDETKVAHNEVTFAKEDDHHGRKRDEEHAVNKARTRNKRGLKNWIKKIFKRKDDDEPATNPPKGKATKKSKHEQAKGKGGSRKRIKGEHGAASDTEVDLLLPKALRRSTLSQQQLEMKILKNQEDEIEAEYEKSEEAEEKTRRDPKGSNENEEDTSGSSETDTRKKSASRGRHNKRRGRRDTNPRSPHAHRRIQNMSKSELLVVQEMFSNLIDSQCGQVSKSTLDNLLSITQTLIEFSSLSEYIPERRKSMDELFNQLLDCSSEVESVRKWGKPVTSDEKKLLMSEGNFDLKTNKIMNSPLKPHKRTKRVRRHNMQNESDTIFSTPIIDVASYEQLYDDIESFNNDSSTSNSIGVEQVTIYKLLRLHLLVTNLVSATCSTTVDSELMLETALLLLEEIIKMVRSSSDYRVETEYFLKRFDISGADRQLNECYDDVLSKKTGV